MPRQNRCILLTAVFLYVFCSGVTLRDRILIRTLHQIEKKALSEPSGRELFEGAMMGMTHSLDDYSTYIPHVERKGYEEELDNRFDGIGIVFQQNVVDKRFEIVYPLPDSPAFKAGLRSGDTLLKIGGQDVKDLSFSDISRLFKGKRGEKVTVSVRPFEQTKSIDLTVKRAPILRPSVEGERIDAEGHPIFHLPGDASVGYVRITSFSDRTAREARDALDRLEENGAKGLILDLRDNPGGYVGVSVQIANFFIRPMPEQDAIVSTRLRNGATKAVYRASDANDVFELPMVVLIDGESASAAEILAACLQDYGRTVIVGTRSFGKGTVQEIFPLPVNSGILQLTDASYWRPSNRNIHRSKDADESDPWGVTPDSEGLLAVSESQRFAQLLIRERRSNVVCDDPESYLADFLKRIPQEVEQYRKDDKENDDDEKTPFVLQGTAPYHDPQLDRAIELLRKKIDENIP